MALRSLFGLFLSGRTTVQNLIHFINMIETCSCNLLKTPNLLASSFNVAVIDVEPNLVYMYVHMYRKTCLKRPLKKKTKNGFSRPIIA